MKICWADTAAHFKAVVFQDAERTMTPRAFPFHRGCENSAMQNSYLSRAVLACYEGEDDAAVAAAWSARRLGIPRL